MDSCAVRIRDLILYFQCSLF